MADDPNHGAKHARDSQPEPAYAPPHIDNDIASYSAENYAAGKRSRKPRRVALVVAIVVVAILVVYLIGAFVFMGRFFPSTAIADEDVSMKTPDEVSSLLDDMIGNYSFHVVGQGIDMTFTADELGLNLDSQSVVDGIMSETNPWGWPIEVFSDHDETAVWVVTYQESEKLNNAINTAVDEFNETAVFPEDATIAYNEGQGAFVVVPSSVGTALNADAIVNEVVDSTMQMQQEIVLGEDVLQQPRVHEDDGDFLAALDDANEMIQVHLNTEMASTPVGEVTPEVVASWITLEVHEDSPEEDAEENLEEVPEESQEAPAEDEIDAALESGEEASVPEEDVYVPLVSAVLDGDAVYAWALDVTSNCDTVGTTRTYTRPDGATITVSGGTYGWYTDTAAFRDELVNAVYARESGTIEVPTTSQGTAYNGRGERDWGAIYIDIDLSAQFVRFYNGDDLVWSSSCVSGKNSSPTPSGVFSINWSYVGRDVTLVGYQATGEKDYESFVSYWMPFYGNSVGLHDASWRSSFGGSIYQASGSHGCVNLPSGNAANLYNIIHEDAYYETTIPVVVHY